MKVTTETVATREVLLTIEPDAQATEQGMRKAAREISRWRPVPGYRPGKAPYALVERMFGRDVILEEAVRDMAPTLYRQAIAEANVEPLQQGQVDIASKDPLVLKVSVPLMPVVTLGDYHTLHVAPEPEVSVSEAQIDEQVERVRRSHAEYVTVERPLEMGDQLLASIKGTVGEETVISEEDANLTLDDKLAPPGFAEALVGMKGAESRDFSLTYPESYEDTNLAGKKVDFTVLAKTIRQVNLPAVNDDLAKTAGDWDTVSQMREALAASLKQSLEMQAREREATAAIEVLVAQSKAEYPAAALVGEINDLLADRQARVQRLGFTWASYLQMLGRTEEQLRDELRPEAERRLVRRLVLTEFARAEELSVGQEELGLELERMAAAYGDRAEEVLSRLRQRDAMLSVYGNLLAREATAWLTAMLTGREDETVGEQPNEAAAEVTAPAQAQESGAETAASEGQAAQSETSA